MNPGYVKYDFELLDIAGEDVMKNFKAKVESIVTPAKLHYEIHIMDEKRSKKSKMKGGNSEGIIRSSTFPYNMFEGTLNTFLNQKTALNEKRKGLFESLFDGTKNAPEKQYNNAVFTVTAAENGLSPGVLDTAKKIAKKLLNVIFMAS